MESLDIMSQIVGTKKGHNALFLSNGFDLLD